MWIILAEIVAALGAFFLTAILQGIVSSARSVTESTNGYKKKAKKTLERLEKKDNDDGKRKAKLVLVEINELDRTAELLLHRIDILFGRIHRNQP